MKRILILIFILMLVGCGNISLYDKYNNNWQLDLPRPVDLKPGKLVEGIPKDYENFDMVFVYDKSVNLEHRDFWQSIYDDGERYDLIIRLFESYGLDKASTVEEKKSILEEYLDINLGPNLSYYYKRMDTEDIILLKQRTLNQVLMLRLIN